MPFTGRIGTPNSYYGNIVLGIVDGFGTGVFSYDVHVLTSRQIRVKFNSKVTDSALSIYNYILASLETPGTAIVPNIESIEFFDETQRSVVLSLDAALTYSKNYSLAVTDVVNEEGEYATGFVASFVANVQDPPQVIGAWQSKRGYVDILFDRSVGPTSSSATFEIRDATLPGPGVVMTQTVWSTENIPETTLRVQLPGGIPTANSFEIDFSGVIDSSLNVATGTVPLTLALRSPLPYSLADLMQLQIIDAYVVDVSSDFIGTSTVRVYFNGPVLDAGTTTNWAAYQSGTHPNTDTVNDITSPDAAGLASLITLVNEIKTDFNDHLIEESVHKIIDTINTIIAPTAIDLQTSIDILNEAQSKINDHFESKTFHIYSDTLHTFPVFTINPGNLSFAISIANNIKSEYNQHLQDEYQLSFSTQYQSPIGQIITYTSYGVPDRAFETKGPYTLFADLHFLNGAYEATIRLEATLQSEDTFSTTSPLNYTGSIVARSASSPGQIQSTIVQPDQYADIEFDREILIPSQESLEVIDSSNLFLESDFEVSSTLPVMMWCYNNLLTSYTWHLSNIASSHLAPDASNGVSYSDYAILPFISVLSVVNSFKLKLNSHMDSNVHIHQDTNKVTAPDATNFESLLVLINDIRNKYLGHINRLGLHIGGSYRIISAPLFNTLKIRSNLIQNEEPYSVNGRIRDTYHDNDIFKPLPPPLGEQKYHDLDIDNQFIGLATRPSLASALPRSGALQTNEGARLIADSVEIFFSKSMKQVLLDSVNLPLTGGSVVSQDFSWITDKIASIRVINMEEISYDVQAIGLIDEAGNSIY